MLKFLEYLEINQFGWRDLFIGRRCGYGSMAPHVSGIDMGVWKFTDLEECVVT